MAEPPGPLELLASLLGVARRLEERAELLQVRQSAQAGVMRAIFQALAAKDPFLRLAVVAYVGGIRDHLIASGLDPANPLVAAVLAEAESYLDDAPAPRPPRFGVIQGGAPVKGA